MRNMVTFLWYMRYFPIKLYKGFPGPCPPTLLTQPQPLAEQSPLSIHLTRPHSFIISPLTTMSLLSSNLYESNSSYSPLNLVLTCASSGTLNIMLSLLNTSSQPTPMTDFAPGSSSTHLDLNTDSTRPTLSLFNLAGNTNSRDRLDSLLGSYVLRHCLFFSISLMFSRPEWYKYVTADFIASARILRRSKALYENEIFFSPS
jgi:hypothetical protein